MYETRNLLSASMAVQVQQSPMVGSPAREDFGAFFALA
jgi:hypothetical protein